MGAIVEGEGSIIHMKIRHKYYAPMVSLTSTSIETIATCLRLAGAGGIHYRKPNDPGRLGNKTQWTWVLTGSASVRDFLTCISPYLTDKREKALEALQCLA